MFNAGVVAATLSGNFSPAGFVAFDSAMHKAKSSMDDAEKKHGRLGKAMAATGKVAALGLGGGILAAGLAIGKSVSLAADFEQQLSSLKSVTGANAAQMLLLKKAAMEAGAATKYSALDAAKAQTELAKGGLSVAQIAGGGLKAALALAAAGELDLSEAAGTTVNAMKLFEIAGSDSIHVADALASAANNTTADVHDFAMALTQGGGAAKAAGLSFDDTIVVLESMAAAGVKGSDAGTSLKTTLAQLANPTAKQTEMTKKLGLAFFDSTGSLKPLPAIAEMLQNKLAGLTRQQRLQAVQTLAGTDGFRTLLSLYEQGGEGIEKLAAKTGIAGSAAKVAAEKQDNLRGKIENLKGSLETAGISLGEGLLPGLTEGAEKATKAINDMAASGDLTRLGEDLGGLISGVAENLPQIIAGFKGVAAAAAGMFAPAKAGLVAFYQMAVKVIDVVQVMAEIYNTITPGKKFDIPIEGIKRFRNELQATVDIANGTKVQVGGKLVLKADAADAKAELRKIAEGDKLRPKVIEVLAKTDSAESKIKALIALGIPRKTAEVIVRDDAAKAALNRIDNLKVRGKVVAIAGRDISASAKIRAIVALGIPPKTARILAEAAQAIAAISGVRNNLASLPTSKTVRVDVFTTNTKLNKIVNLPASGSSGVSSKPPKGSGVRAAGRGAIGAETALVGEGRGGELVGNPVDGWAWVAQPTIVDLKPQDSVIPDDPQYAGRALGFMFAALGVPGYAKGKKATTKAKAPRDMPIPAAVRYGAVPEDALNEERDTARESYQKRKDRVHSLDVDIREQRKKVSQAKKGKAKESARAKLQDLESARHHYKDGDGGLKSLADMRTRWEDLRKQATVLHTYNREIERLNTLQENDRTRMGTAAKKGDEKGYNAAKKARSGLLGRLRDIYAKAVGLAKPGSSFAAELEGKLATVESDIADAAGESYAPPDLSPAEQAAQDAAERLRDTGMTDAEASYLRDLQAQQSLASLTTGLEDDKDAAGGIEAFLTGMLSAVQNDPARGGSASVRDIADQLKQARDNVASFSTAGTATNDNADLQAQLEQQRTRADTAERSQQISDRALSVFQGAGDIGSARIVINTLHPGDSRTLAAIADASVAGMSQQGSISSPRTYLGI
jgi:TP901 family phage tail tape measure protein